jgi:protein-tyrosine phosphatase
MRGVLVARFAIRLTLLGSLAFGCAPRETDAPEEQGAASSASTGSCFADAPDAERVDCGFLMNLRDLGGIRAAGLRIREGRVYRSDHLGQLNDTGQAFVASLGLGMAADFRAPDEIQSSGEDRIDSELRKKYPVVDPQASKVDEFTHALLAKDYGALARLFPGEKAKTSMAEGYANFVLDDASEKSFRDFFKDLVATVAPASVDGAPSPPAKPVLFHCVSGKDRTGFAAAVLLKILGASDEDIAADYLKSNDYRAGYMQYWLSQATDEAMVASGVSDPAQMEQVRQMLRAIMGVDPTYLAAAFAAIDARYDSFDAYVAEGLRLSSAELAALRGALLQP